MMWALSLLGVARKALQAVLGVIGRYPLQCALIALLCLSGWLWSGKKKALSERDTARSTIIAQAKGFRAAQIEAQAKAFEARQRQQADFDRKAKVSDEKHELQLASALDRTDAFIRANRVRSQAIAGAGSGAIAPSQSDGAGLSQILPTDSVMVSADDVRKCTGAVSYATDAHGWAMGLNAP